MEIPETRFTNLGDDRIVYQVVGDGPIDLLLVSPSGTAVDIQWEYPPAAAFLRRLASFSRLIMFDRRGWGASDRVSDATLPLWEEWVDDVRAVLDAADSKRAAIFGITDAGSIACLFAATEPERTHSLILFTATARFLAEDGYPGGMPETEVESAVKLSEKIWGTDAMAALATPSIAKDTSAVRWYARAARLAASAHDAAEYFRAAQQLDIRDALPSIRVPTLVLHRKDFRWIPVDQGRYLAERIGGARFVIVPGVDASPDIDPTGEILDNIEEFLTGVPALGEPDRVLAAILFTDIVGSTEMATAMGDRRWKKLLESHDAVTRTIVDQFRGRLVKMTGDGAMATFDGPGRAIRCANRLREAMLSLGIDIRAGMHSGEVELRADGDIGGIAVHIAARVAGLARPNELLVSSTVKDLVAGSGILFEDRGSHSMKGIPGMWRLSESPREWLKVPPRSRLTLRDLRR